MNDIIRIAARLLGFNIDTTDAALGTFTKTIDRLEGIKTRETEKAQACNHQIAILVGKRDAAYREGDRAIALAGNFRTLINDVEGEYDDPPVN